MIKKVLKEIFLILGLSFIVFVIGIVILNLPIFLQDKNTENAKNEFRKELEKDKIEISSSPTLIIPALEIKVPIVFSNGKTNDEVMEDLKKGVVHLGGTALPGEKGNSVITGHSSDYPWNEGGYKQVFALLDKLEANDMIYIDYQSNRYNYKVTGKEVIENNRLDILNQTEGYILTLMTCYPPGTTFKRLIVRGELIQ